MSISHGADRNRVQSLKRAFFGLGATFAIGTPLAILTNIVLARILPTAEFGNYGLAISLASVLAIPVVSAMPLLITREVSGYARERDWARYQGLANAAWFWSAVYALILVVCYLLLCRTWPVDLRYLYGLSVMLVPVMSLTAIVGGQLRGFGRPSTAALPVQVLQPLLLIVGFLGIAGVGRLSSATALQWYFAVGLMVVVLMFYGLHQGRPDGYMRCRPDYSHHARWARAFLPFVVIGGLNILNTQLAILMLGYMGDTESVAYLRVADRGAQLVAFPLMVLTTVLAPEVVRHIKDGDQVALAHLARRSARLAGMTAAPIALTLIVFGRPIIGLTFGADYVDASYAPMIVLIVTQIALTAMGPAGLFLAMGGQENHNLIGQIIGLITLTSLGLLLLPSAGALGAAVAASGSMIGMTLYMVIMTRWRLHVRTWLS